MRLFTKLTPPSAIGRGASLGDLFDTLRHAWINKADRRVPRPLQDIDGWSDQAEVAFYEGARLSRYP